MLFRSINAAADGNISSSQLELSLPILNVGYPKCGSSTLTVYFHCIGLKKASHGQEGHKFYGMTKHGVSPFHAASHSKGREFVPRKTHGKVNDAYLQLDSNFGPGMYPQIQLLDEMHEFQPNSTFIMNFRPIFDWINSVKHWHGMGNRMAQFKMPGLMLTPDQRMVASLSLEERREQKKGWRNSKIIGKGLFRQHSQIRYVSTKHAYIWANGQLLLAGKKQSIVVNLWASSQRVRK